VYSVEDNSIDLTDEVTAKDVQSTLEALPTPAASPTYPVCLKRWERQLPQKYVVAATPSANSLDIKVEIVTTDTQETKSVKALLDCGADGLFIDQDYVRKNQLTTRALTCPIPVYNVDGMANEAGSICEVIDVVLQYRDHAERAQFTVTGLGNQDMILGYSWLREHNPEVDWSTGEVKMSRCPGHCSTCRTEIKQECHKRQVEVRHLHSCWAGSMPTIEEIFEDPPEFPSDNSEAEFEVEYPLDNPDEIEPGDRVFMTTVHDPVEFIRATTTTSQRLAEAFTRNSTPLKSFHESVPSQFHDFEDVFSKVAFDALPDCKPWDHAIELELGVKASSTKVYPLSPNKQMELDTFIEENLASG
jgi:Retroviral aspartyl protease